MTTQKLDWKVTSRVGSLDNVKHKPGGGKIQIFDEKYASGRPASEARTPGSGNNSGANTPVPTNGKSAPSTPLPPMSAVNVQKAVPRVNSAAPATSSTPVTAQTTAAGKENAPKPTPSAAPSAAPQNAPSAAPRGNSASVQPLVGVH